MSAMAHTPIHAAHGLDGALPTTAPALKALANDAIKAGLYKKSIHLFTLAIDLVTRGMPRNGDGVATPEALSACDTACDGELSKLLSNRSFAFLKSGDRASAIEDGESCVAANPTFEKGHMRLVLSLDDPARQLAACQRGLIAVPFGTLLLAKEKQLIDDAQAIATAAGSAPLPPAADILSATRAAADDPSHPQQLVAAADLGAALAVGAYGVAKDVVAAERYLRKAAAGGEVNAQRNLGLLLLDGGDAPDEAARHLETAARAGDEQAAAVLVQMGTEAHERAIELRQRLVAMAASGDARATECLRETALAS